MLRYTCVACKAGMHHLCHGKQPPPPGMLGGSECTCRGECKASGESSDELERRVVEELNEERIKTLEAQAREAKSRIKALQVYNDEEIAAKRGAMEGWVRVDDVMDALKVIETMP